MDSNEHTRALRAALDYVLARLVEVEALCERVEALRLAVEDAYVELDALEGSPGGADLDALQAIIERVSAAQLEWEQFARQFGEAWGARGTLH
jgi:hypothetical protein